MADRPERRYPTSEIAAYMERMSIRAFLEKPIEERMDAMDRASSVMRDLVKSKCVKRDGKTWNNEPIWMVLRDAEDEPKEIQDAILLLRTHDYLVFRKTSNQSQEIYKVLTDEPQNIYAITTQVYGNNYTSKNLKNVGHALRRLRDNSLVEMTGKTCIHNRWVSCWRAIA